MVGPQLCNVMDIKHLFIRGNYRGDIFFDKVDLINAWNRIWLSAEACGVIILAVEILTNHLHICAKSCTNTVGPWMCNYMHHLRMSLSLYFNYKYKVHGSLGSRRYGRANVVDPQDDGGEDLKDLIRYIIRNVTHHNITEQYQNWPYSTYGFLFDLKDKTNFITGKDIPEALKRAYLPASCIFPLQWSMTEDGLIVPPDNLFPRQELESLFNNKAYYLKCCGMITKREGEGESNERLLCTPHRPTQRITDQEIIDVVNAKSLVPVVTMSREQRKAAIKTIHKDCPNASLRQLERIFAIPYRTICYLLGK